MKKKIYLEKKIKRDFLGIYNACGKIFWHGCGSYLIDGKKYKYDKQMLGKQMLLFDLSKKNSKILEIGVYMGHSILIMLAANPKLSITGIDIDKRFSPNAINYLKKNYKKSNLNLIIGDSIDTLNNLREKFDLFHIDGDHKSLKIFKEIIACTKLSKNKIMKILFDDVDMMISIDKSLRKAFYVKKYIKPKSKSPNLYIEIKLEKTNILKFKLFFLFYFLFEIPKIIIDFIKSLLRKLIVIFIGKKNANRIGGYILKTFNNDYMKYIGKKLNNI